VGLAAVLPVGAWAAAQEKKSDGAIPTTARPVTPVTPEALQATKAISLVVSSFRPLHEKTEE